MADTQILQAYRHLYRGLLHAVQFSKPARFVARDQLRAAFREKDAVLDIRGVARTIRFLDAATKSRGIEHKVLKNILFTQFWRQQDGEMTFATVQKEETRLAKKSEFHRNMLASKYKHYDMTVAMLNKSMGLCLR